MRYCLVGIVGLLFGLGCCTSTLAGTSRGFYLGLNAGYGVTNYHPIKFIGAFQPTHVDDSALAPKISFGYAINRYIAAELGVFFMPKPHFKGLQFNPQQMFKIKHNVVYFVGKLSLPIAMFSPYVKFGYGYVVRDAITIRVNGPITALKGGEFANFIYGVGVNYYVTSHWILDASWMQAPSKLADQLPASNYYSVGLAYKF